MTTDPSDLDAEGWRDWTDVAATDLADPGYSGFRNKSWEE